MPPPARSCAPHITLNIYLCRMCVRSWGQPQGLGSKLPKFLAASLDCDINGRQRTNQRSISYSSKSVSDLCNAINWDLQNLSSWLQGNKLSLNVAKTQSMILGTVPNLRRLDSNDSNSFPLFQISGDEIESTGNIKYLGVQIDSSLNWKEQINVAIGKISRGIGMLKYAKRYLSLQTIQRMYFSIVGSHFRYCCSVRVCAGDTALRKLQKLQNRAARIVTNSPFDHASLPLIPKLGWLTVNEMIDFETACMVYKALHGLAARHRNVLTAVHRALCACLLFWKSERPEFRRRPHRGRIYCDPGLMGRGLEKSACGS